MTSIRVPRFAGALAQQQLAFARERWGPATERALAALGPDDRDELELATAVSWVRIDAMARFHDLLAGEVGRPVEQTHPEIVAGGSRRTFTTLWRFLLRLGGGARFVMTRAPVVYSKTYDTGTLETISVDDRGAAFRIRGWPDAPDFVLRGLRAGIGIALEGVVGRDRVVVTSKRTSDGVLFDARWT